MDVALANRAAIEIVRGGIRRSAICVRKAEPAILRHALHLDVGFLRKVGRRLAHLMAPLDCTLFVARGVQMHMFRLNYGATWRPAAVGTTPRSSPLLVAVARMESAAGSTPPRYSLRL